MQGIPISCCKYFRNQRPVFTMQYIFCINRSMLYTFCNSTDTCASYLLEDNNSAHEVVIFNEGEFNYICGGGVTSEAGRILCLEKGYHGVKSIRRNIAADTTRGYSVLQASYECDGSENSLCECTVTTSNTCNTSEIAAVECYLPG